MSKNTKVILIILVLALLVCCCLGLIGVYAFSTSLRTISTSFTSSKTASNVSYSYESLDTTRYSSQTSNSTNYSESSNSSSYSIDSNNSNTSKPIDNSNNGIRLNPLNLNFDVKDSQTINAFGLNQTSDYPSKSAKSIYKDITFTPAKVSNSANVDAVTYLYKFLKKGGNVENTVLQSGYDISKLKEMVETSKAGNVTETVPKEYEYLYIGSQVKQALTQELLDCRNEYFDYMKFKKVNQKYLDKFDEIFPADLSTFVYDDGNDPTSARGAYITTLENGKRKFFMSAVDIYFGSYLMKKSGIVSYLESTDKERYEKTIRSISIRATCYHEYTHVLQDAVEEVNEGTQRNAYFEQGQLMQTANQYLSTLFNKDYYYYLYDLRDAVGEAQADGIGFQMLIDIFDFSPTQRQAWFDYEYGRLKYNRERVNQMALDFAKDFSSDSGLVDLPSKLSLRVILDIDITDWNYDGKKYLSNMVNDRYIPWLGYLNPNPKVENEYTFKYLQTTHIVD